MASFKWRVATQGYEWVEEYHSPDLSEKCHLQHHGLCLIPTEWVELSTKRLASKDNELAAQLANWSWSYREYEPLKSCSGLFRIFADTQTTRDGIRAFADEYGHLGEGAFWIWETTNKPEFASAEERADYEFTIGFVAVPQSFEEWQEAIVKMRTAVTLWERLRRNRSDNKTSRELQALVDMQLTDIRVIARFQLLPRLSYQAALHVMPFTLLGAMWVQLAQAISGDKTHHQCEACRRWFELSPEVNRKSRQYCSDACRSRAYRSRKQEALRLAAKGTSLGKIAEQLGSDKQTIAGWVRHENRNK